MVFIQYSMQNEQIREEERDGKTKGQRVWNKKKRK